MDTVLGVSMAPTTVRIVLVEGENADGVTIDEDYFEVAARNGSATRSGPEQVVAAILGTREGAVESGYQLTSIGVTWTDPAEAAALRDMLAARKAENVMLVSAFLAAVSLAQTVGNATNYAHTALLYVEPDTATLAVVDSADGSISDVHRHPLPPDDDQAVAQLAKMVASVEALEIRPESVFVVGSDVDIRVIKPALEAATSLPLSVPAEPETALARGAALASANAPLFSSSTAALAYAKDFGTGAADPCALAPEYLYVADVTARPGEQALAYSAASDEKPDAYTAAGDRAAVDREDFRTGAVTDYAGPQRRSFLPVGSALAAVFVVGVVALAVVLAISVRPTVGVRPNPGHNVVAPTPPPAATAVPAPVPEAPAPVPPADAPVPVAPTPMPAPPVRAPAAPAPAPMPVAPPPPPVAAPPIVAPPLIVVPLIPQLPHIFGPPVEGPPLVPRGGGHGGGGHGGFGIPGVHM
ncbi:DUF7159 family protein [Mycobacterium nebraskense]